MHAVALVMLSISVPPATDWRAVTLELARAGKSAEAVAYAERARTPWLGAHLARRLPPPPGYVGWVAAPGVYLAYGLTPRPWIIEVPDREGVDALVRELHEAIGADPRGPAKALDARLLAPLGARLGEGPWTFATDGALDLVPFSVVSGVPVVHALSERAAALAAFRAEAARRRPPDLVAFARAGPGARAEIELAAAALGGAAALLAGGDAGVRLRLAAYDGTLTLARFVLVTATTGHRDGAIVLEFDEGADGSFAAADATHLSFSAELIVLSACDGAVGAAVAESGARAGAALVLITAWRKDDAAAAQFVAALFEEIARGSTVRTALHRVQQAFAAGVHGDAYRHPWYWSGWQLWGG